MHRHDLVPMQGTRLAQTWVNKSLHVRNKATTSLLFLVPRLYAFGNFQIISILNSLYTVYTK